mmetsp:Transcript_106979/g.169083  ORF Transcript_106979/g.169083 Transcript_106979/m.169083 type:complete len:276 (+) Transcript_106979:67-894(+)|eukprot:CAMPEP_0169085260 /NCGR_PEP_ID=MMETSP1015-20121227/13063_1 /TAXON_ID=342587 /ORGANISM="Karlodinium micrum, Strain CCMP2283" /LENGTH=275 /DNA_ID=CAMNT_0009145331 /DNA_START=67 /DNA_END=894 /DNA_ORIENTATION=+
MTVCHWSASQLQVVLRLGFLAVWSSLVVADVKLVEEGGIFSLKQVTTLKPFGCTEEINACRALYVASSAGLTGQKMCDAFHLYQSCYYGHMDECGIIEKQQQDQQFIEARTELFRIHPKCKVSTTPWDSSLGVSGSKISASWFGYQGSSPNMILSDSGSHLSGTEPSGPISGSMGLYMNIAQWIVFASCCGVCCVVCGVMACCHPRSKRALDLAFYDDELDDFMEPGFMAPSPAMAPMYPGGASFNSGAYAGYGPSMASMPTMYLPGTTGNPYGL